MVKSTLIARVADGLALAASMDDDTSNLTEYINQAKQLCKKLNSASEQRCSLESPPYVFHYIIEFGVCYLCLCERSFPKKLAYQYLEELQKEFQEQYGNEIQRVARPYAYLKFGYYKSYNRYFYPENKETVSRC